MTKRMVTLAVAALGGCALAYDAGPHQEMTTAAMMDFGFSGDAIGATRLTNWLVDYYSNTGSFQAELGLLHFDNLPTTHNVKVYWGYFANNTRRALEAAARANDPFKAISILGMSLHAVQDFYTHSTWAETHPRGGGAYRSETYFTDVPADNKNPQQGLYTGWSQDPLEQPGLIQPQDHWRPCAGACICCCIGGRMPDVAAAQAPSGGAQSIPSSTRILTVRD